MTDTASLVAQIEAKAEAQDCLLVITENASIARELKTQLLERNRSDRGNLSRILTLETWLDRLAQQLASKNKLHLASTHQMLQIWEQLIERDSEEMPELQPGNMARLAHKAWLRLLGWQVAQEQLAELEQFNQLQLGKWCESFESRLEELGLSQRELILKQCADPSGHREPQILFLTTGAPAAPLHMDILKNASEILEQAVWRSEQNSNCSLASFDSLQAELEAASAWANTIACKDSNARIAILCTESGAIQKNLIRTIKTAQPEIETAICFPRSAVDSGYFDSALRLLELNRSELTRAECRAIIRNPFWGDFPNDIDQRSLWETELCDLERKYLRTADLINTARDTATKLHTERSDSLAQKLAQARALLPENSSAQSLYSWTGIFSQQLHSLGWPGSRCLTTEDRAQVNLFHDLLQQLVSLSAVVDSTLSCSKALSLLRQLAQDCQMTPDAPARGINLLNTIEGAVGFSHIWLLDASADQWPGLVKPDPLIPIQLQLEQQMPRCHPEQERHFCVNLFDQLRGNCKEVVFSISQKDADQLTEFSPLLPDCSSLKLDFLNQPQSESPTAPPDWQWIDCSKGPDLDITEDFVRGGSNIFNLMTASPFLAFARYRLSAEPFAEAYIGIGPHHRGNILHACLDQLWAELENSEKLRKTDELELTSLVEQAVQQQLLHWQSKNLNLDLAYFEELKTSFTGLLLEWLSFECKRGEFFVEGREQELHTQIGPLNLRLRADRIDRLSDGSKLLIDYKSGTSGTENDLTSSPPAAAQLPLYAVSLEEQLAGLCFAQVVAGAPRLRGIARDENVAALRVIEDWPSLISQWQKDLTELAENYASGDSRVFETQNFFGRRDDMASLHRMAEYQDLMDWYANR